MNTTLIPLMIGLTLSFSTSCKKSKRDKEVSDNLPKPRPEMQGIPFSERSILQEDTTRIQIERSYLNSCTNEPIYDFLIADLSSESLDILKGIKTRSYPEHICKSADDYMITVFSGETSEVFYANNCPSTEVLVTPLETLIATLKLTPIGDSGYSKDSKENIYYKRKKIVDSDSPSFEVISTEYGFARDKNNIYRRGLKLTEIDKETFEIINKSYYKDSKNVYYELKMIEGVDPETFEFIGNYYSKDAKRVYLKGRAIAGADPTTFRLDCPPEPNFDFYSSSSTLLCSPPTFKEVCNAKDDFQEYPAESF